MPSLRETIVGAWSFIIGRTISELKHYSKPIQNSLCEFLCTFCLWPRRRSIKPTAEYRRLNEERLRICLTVPFRDAGQPRPAAEYRRLNESETKNKLLTWRVEIGVLAHFTLEDLALTLAVKQDFARLKVLSLDALLS